jgi:hypothetical protein
LQGVSANYTNELMIANSEALRKAQEKISHRIFELLGLTLFRLLDAPLVPDATAQIGAIAKRVRPQLGESNRVPATVGGGRGHQRR